MRQADTGSVLGTKTLKKAAFLQSFAGISGDLPLSKCILFDSDKQTFINIGKFPDID